VNTPIDPALLADLAALTPIQQQSVVDFVVALRDGLSQSKPLPQGTPVEALLALGGLFSPDDLDEIEKAIEEGCEQVEHGSW
jgi:hypothetical protein